VLGSKDREGCNVKINTTIQYGVKALCDIAYHSTGTPVPLNVISERHGISPRYLEQIFVKLRQGGLVKSVRGPAGGYFLARRPEKITVGNIIRALDGKSIQLAGCNGGRRGKEPYALLEQCVSEIWGEASKTLNDYFDSITLDRICEEARERGVEI
jgi:Rrf2 family transcriptional regulator, iron-sulfur cluster assembly transcription factor